MRILSLIFLLTFFTAAYAQNGIRLKVVPVDREQGFLSKKYKLKESYKNEAEVEKALQSLIVRLHANGYITASIDSIVAVENHRNAQLFVGRQYEWSYLSRGNVDEQILKQSGYKEKFFSERTFNYNNVQELLEDILQYSENNGYPFAQVKLDSIQITGNEIAAVIKLEQNQLIKFDTLNISGKTKISKRYLQSYLNIRPERLYDEEAVQNITKRIEELPFLQEAKSFDIVFTGDKAKINLYLTDRKTSQVDFILGILPNNSITGKVLITGEVNLNLVSPFGTGKEIHLNWKRLQTKTQTLDVGFSYPYLFRLPLGLDFNFNLFKRDTLYLDIQWEIGGQYLFVGGNYLKVFVNNKITNILSVDTAAIKASRKLPKYIDVRNTLFGAEYYHENLDYRFNPRDGFVLRLTAGAGMKKIRKNSRITSLTDPESPERSLENLYDSLDLNSVQYKFGYSFEKYWPIKNRSTFKISSTGAAIFSENLFENELYRIGGVRLLRGFDEEEIYTSLFNVLLAEFRFLLSPNSYWSIFVNGAYVENRSGGAYENDFPYGFGTGLTFETKAGLFSVSYALGSRNGNPINFRSAKIHFGYINYF